MANEQGAEDLNQDRCITPDTVYAAIHLEHGQYNLAEPR